MPNYKGFDINTTTTPKPWGTRQEQWMKDCIDNILGDSIDATSRTGGHRHNKLYESDGGAAAITVDAAGDLTFSGGITGDVQITGGLGVNQAVNANYDISITKDGIVFEGGASGDIAIGYSSGDARYELAADGDFYFDSAAGDWYFLNDVDVAGALVVDGNATLGNASGDAHTVNGTLSVRPNNQTYKILGDGNIQLFIEGQNTNNNSFVNLASYDGDGTDFVGLQIFGVGNARNGTANSEYLRITYDNTQSFDLYSVSSGTGTDRKLRLYAGTSNTGQLTLATSGNTGLGTDTPQQKLTVYGATEAYTQFANADTGIAAATDGIIIGINTSENLLIKNQETDKYNIYEVTGGSALHDFVVNGDDALIIASGYKSYTPDGTVEERVNSDGLFVQFAGLRVDSGSNLTDPGNGNIAASGNITCDGGVGAGGQAVNASYDITSSYKGLFLEGSSFTDDLAIYFESITDNVYKIELSSGDLWFETGSGSFQFQNKIIANASTTALSLANGDLEFSDGVNIDFGTTTGTKIGTATTQKLGFFNKTPVTQRLKANYNNWAAFTDVVDALVDLGLFDQA